LKRDFLWYVDNIIKPFTEIEFQKTVSIFLKEVRFFSNQNGVTLDLGKQKHIKLAVDSIMYFV